ncbi:GGDEF domain-containing protein, partial [Acinetobacter baumannii]
DKLLKSLAQRLRDIVPEGCSIARHGGDEFVLVVPNFAKGSFTDDSVSRIFSSVSAPFDIDEHHLYTTPSIGISVFPEDGGTTNELIQKADLAMY